MVKKLALVMCVCIAGCEVTRDHHGHVFTPQCMEKVKVGSCQEDVVTALGEPTYILPYDPMTWYYLSHSRETKALLKPKVSQALCYSLTFSPQGRLNKIEKSDVAHSLAISSQAIPLPSSHSEEFFKQMFRNIGRFQSVKVAAP